MKAFQFIIAVIIGISIITGRMAYASVEDEYKEAVAAANQRDLAYAIEIWTDLASRGHAKSQYHLGALYRTGSGVKKDLDKAFMWFQRAAEQGNPLAQYNLGVMYEKGWGTERDTKKAEDWYRRAAKQDVAMAKEKIKNSVTDSFSTIDKSKLSNKDRSQSF